jgi:hypothetical protein
LKKISIYTFIFKIIHIINYVLLFFISVLKLKRKKNDTKLVIEAGIVGWDLIDINEIYYSAVDYLGNDRVYKNIIQKDISYIKQVILNVNKNKPTHYLYDPRTGSQNYIVGIFQSLTILYLFRIKNICPIVLLTDFPVRKWRIQAGILTTYNGITLTLMSTRDVCNYFPHNRIFGPILMPLSKKTFTNITYQKNQLALNKSYVNNVVFVGSLYEPRTSKLFRINDVLARENLKIDFFTRKLGHQRVSNEEYWTRLISSKIVITTSDQLISNGIDDLQLPHLIYRYTEAIATGNLLLAPEVPGLDNFFIADIDYVNFNDEFDASKKIIYYLNNLELLNSISKSAYDKLKTYVEYNIFWSTVNSNLNSFSLK